MLTSDQLARFFGVEPGHGVLVKEVMDGSAAAKAESVSRAMSIVDALMAQASIAGCTWKDPVVGLDEHGDVSMEWWNRERKVTLYIAPHCTEYLRSWGANMDNEMEIEVLEKGVFEHLWGWLNRS